MVADDTKAIDSVLKADTKRLELMAEEKKLTQLIDEGNTESEVNDRLKQVH